MRNYLKAICFIAVILITAPFAVAFEINETPNLIQVITYNNRAIQNIDAAHDRKITIKVYNLDSQFNLQDELGKDLPNDKNKAIEIAKQRMQAVNPDRWETMWRGALLAKKYKISSAPAIIFNNGQQVIYGITDIEKALKIYKEYKRK